VILVGAQAIYLHTGEGDLAISQLTTDGDIALDPELLEEDPLLSESLAAAQFTPHLDTSRIGTWLSPDGIEVDLLVPEAVAGPGTRAARLGLHGNRVARRARGLEAALVDNSIHRIHSLETDDDRVFEIRVAGPGALLVAKLHKLGERVDAGKRVEAKDASDTLRLLQLPSEELESGIVAALNRDVSREVTLEAIGRLRGLFGSAASRGSQLAAESVGDLEEPGVIAESCAALSTELLARLSPSLD
jgi:hypothetical protein